MKQYRVEILNKKTGRIFDHYIIKVYPEELARIEASIYARHPHNVLAVSFQEKA
jgi:hypothetical protein